MFFEPNNYSSGFTLLELLIVIGILAIISVTMIIVINPTDLLARARDSNRISNLSAINTSINVLMSFYSDASLGSADTVYTSLPSDQPDCSDLGLPDLPAGWTYHCVTEANLRKIDANGWIPIDFTQMDTGSPISHLAVDPINTVASGYYYTYTPGGSWELNGILESEKYQQDTTVSKGNLPGVLSFGSDSSLSPIFNNSGLIGYWKLEEGLGTTANDSSGNSNTGTLTNGPTWTTGKINNALSFDGVDDYVQLPYTNIFDVGDFSIELWIKITKLGVWNPPFSIGEGTTDRYVMLDVRATNYLYFTFYSDDSNTNFKPSVDTWYHIVATFERASKKQEVFVDGVSKRTRTSTGVPDINTGANTGNGIWLGKFSTDLFNGLIDEVRIYNRALSAAEIQARYNATK